MIRMLSAFTTELDDASKAVNDIIAQLDLKNRLLGSSIGIMYFYSDFIESGIVKALSQALPFPLVGCTTSNSAVHGIISDITLTLSVLTSDDCSFSAALSDPMKDDCFVVMESLYKKICAGKNEKPAMLYLLTPYLRYVIGDEYIAALDGFSGGVPIFGNTAFTHDAHFRNIQTCFCGEAYADSAILVAFFGPLKPEFFLTEIPDDRIVRQQAVITDSYKNMVRRVNGVPVLDYLETLGLAENGQLTGIASIPIVVFRHDGTKMIRTIFGEVDGELICSGSMPANATIGFAACDREFVISSTRLSVTGSAFGAGRPALVVSCGARRWTLGTDVYSEIREVASAFGDTLPYHFAYTSGEFCPVQKGGGALENRYHNYTMGVCLL